MKVNVYNQSGKKMDSVTLPKELVTEGNVHLLAQAVRVFENRQHPGLAKVKSRSEVKGSTRKIYRQKGTGGARHGARKAPLFVGGGIANGPTGHTRTLSMPQKMREKALQIALGVKAKEGKLLLVDGFSKLGKTKDAQKMLDAIVKEENVTSGKVTLALSDKNHSVSRYLRNLKSTTLVPYKQLNAYSVFSGGVVVLDSEALDEGKTEKKEKVEKKVEAKPVKKAPVKKTAAKKTAKK